VIKAVRQWWSRRQERRAAEALQADADKAAIALDIMLSEREWYGGIRVVVLEETGLPHIEVLIVDAYPQNLSTWIPPRVGVTPVLVRFGTLPKALGEQK
jgi:hypothetical protein